MAASSVIILTMLIVSCATNQQSVIPSKKYTVFFNRHPYSFEITVQEFIQEIKTPVVGGTLIKLEPNEQDPKFLYASRKPGSDSWFLKDHPEINIDKVALMPYYSLTSYRILTELKKSGVDILDPECPPETKYLVLFIVGKAEIPWAGCVI
jgi:hypothetical protein